MMQKGQSQNKRGGFTLVEALIAAAIFLIFALGVYQGYLSLQAAIASARYKALAADLANARFEVVKNMPYSDVGTVGGDPAGLVPAAETVVSDNVSFGVATTIMNIDDPFDGTAATGDPFPNDYKLVEINISCATCKNFTPVVITGWVAPKNLEGI